MSVRSSFAFRSFVKTTLASLALAATAVLVACLGWIGLHGPLAVAVSAAGLVVALGAAALACAGVIVLIRHRRGVLGQDDLFLALNRSRETGTVASTPAAHVTRGRRWLAQRFLGHDLVVGDWVEVKPWEEIRQTLDARGCLEQLPFLPEMVAMCGRRVRVFRCLHRLFDYRKTRRMRHMDGTVLLLGATCNGSHHGGCEAAGYTIWKAAWLRRVELHQAECAPTNEPPARPPETAVLRFGTQAPHYVCQMTQLQAASRPIGNWSVINFLRPVIAGNVTLAAFVVGWLTHLFNELQHQRGGVSFPAFEPALRDGPANDESPLIAGDHVVVRPSREIRATLNDRMLHRGLWFEPDMLKHCGHRYPVESEVRKLIDIVTGEMRTMKTPAYVLRNVYFSGERQLFNAQCEPLFWRGAWLRRSSD